MICEEGQHQEGFKHPSRSRKGRDKRRDGHNGPTFKWADARLPASMGRMWPLIGLESVTKCCEVGAAVKPDYLSGSDPIRGLSQSL